MSALFPPLFAFRAEALPRAVAAVAARHQVAAARRGAIATPGRLEEIQAELRTRSEDRLQAYAWELSPGDLRGVAGVMGTWPEDIQARAAKLLVARPRADCFVPIFRHFQDCFDNPHVRRAAQALAVVAAPRPQLDLPPMTDLLGRLLGANDPPRVLCAAMAFAQLSFDDVVARTAGILRAGALLMRATRQALLVEGTVEQLRREGPRRLISWIETESPEVRRRFGWSYLEKVVEAASPDEPVAHWLLGAFGTPRTGSAQFWERVDPELCEHLQAELNRRRLGGFFETHRDNVRYQFWRRFLDKLWEVDVGREGGHLILDFGSFCVVEFAEVGNAAYIYAGVMAKELRERTVTANGDLKGSSCLSRVIHRYGWQERCQAHVELWLRARDADSGWRERHGR